MNSHRRRAPSKSKILRVAAVQMKFQASIEQNLDTIERLTLTAVRRHADVVLLPECAVTGYAYDFATLTTSQVKDALVRVGHLAAKLKVNLLVGTPVFRRRTLYNCLVVFNRRGAVTYCYAKNQLTPDDRRYFKPGNSIALFRVERIPVTTIICHERRYPELVRLAVMAGARILFHPNAGMDTLAVSRKKRGGRDGIVARAFENAIYYVFANSVGPQSKGKWSAGDSKIVAPDQRILQLADNHNETVLVADLDIAKATRLYAKRGMQQPRFLTAHWKAMIQDVRNQARNNGLDFDLP